MDSGNHLKQLVTVSWQQVKHYIVPDNKTTKDVFDGVDGKDDKRLGVLSQHQVETMTTGGTNVNELNDQQKRHHFVNQPALVFLGVDETSAPTEQRSLPVSKPTDDSTLESHSPFGIPYWAIDVTSLHELKQTILKQQKGQSEFQDMRTGMQSIPETDAAIGAQGRALIDWNRRNKFCPACGQALRQVWAGWKRTCVPTSSSSNELDGLPVCTSKKGVHNFNYPRTDPVCIMAITTPDRNQILLGRQKNWPKKFYSCLAGFIESGETIEESVRREVYEEAGIEVDEVFYHSSQPWPYPSSLMIGAIGVAKPNQTIRCDLDNELEDAQWFTREQVLNVLSSDKPLQLSKEQVARLDDKQTTTSDSDSEQEHDDKGVKRVKKRTLFKMPPATAIANTLVHAWANNDFFGAQPLSNSRSTSPVTSNNKL
ncbi:NADH pyrophosphatase [Microbotryomycetes sp. JL221]|nr:NADH pyrophosphatase [Microbotryomycetes sp. JL221]